MMSMRAQRGLSYWGVMGLILFGVLGLKVGATLGPVYMDDHTIDTLVAERLISSPEGASIERLELELGQQFTMNNLRDINIKNVLTVTNVGGGIIVMKDYEVRKNFVGNLDFAMHFKKEFDQRALKASGE